MRLLLLVIVALVALIQYPLWMGRGGWFSVWDMQAQVMDQRTINEGLTARNKALAAEVEDLRSGTEASEERARSELSMMRQGEVFVQILPLGVQAPELKPTTKPPAKPISPSAPPTAASPVSKQSPR
jgi:cell division protein FtsB